MFQTSSTVVSKILVMLSSFFRLTSPHFFSVAALPSLFGIHFNKCSTSNFKSFLAAIEGIGLRKADPSITPPALHYLALLLPVFDSYETIAMISNIATMLPGLPPLSGEF